MPLDMESVKELKQKIKLARNKELSFALALGKKPEDCALIMHKERGGDKLLLQVKKIDGVQPQKSCYGTLTVDGQLVKLACRTEPPAGLVKNFRIFFRSNGIAMKLAVLAPGESEFKLDPEDTVEGEGAAPATSPVVENAAAPSAQEAFADAVEGEATRLSEAETESLQARINAIKDALGGLEGAILDKISEGHRRAQMLLVSGDGNRAIGAKVAKALNQLEAALKQIAQRAAAQKTGEKTDQRAEQESAEPPSSAPDPQARDWQEAFAKLDPHVRRVLAAGHGDIAKIQAIWAYAQEKAAAGNFTAALKAVGQLPALLSQAVKAAEEASAASEDNSQVKAAWDQVADRYGPVVAALKEGPDPRLANIKAAWDMAVQAAGIEDFDKANMILGRLRPVLDKAPSAPEPPAPKPPAPKPPRSMAPGNTDAEPDTEPGAGGEADAPPAPVVEAPAEPVAEPAAEDPVVPAQAPDPVPDPAPQGEAAESAPKKTAVPEGAPLADSTSDPEKKQALEKIDKARGQLIRVEGMIAAFGAPHPGDWGAAVQQVGGLLSPAEDTSVDDIEKAAKQAGTLLGDLEPRVKQLTLDKQTWQQQHPLFSARLVPIKAHALKGVDPVKTKLKALEEEIAAAEADAAGFDFQKAAGGIVSFLMRGDALEALADDFAHYRAIEADRLVLVNPRRAKTSLRAPVQASIDALVAAYDGGVTKAEVEDYEAAVLLMNTVPALSDQVDLLLAREGTVTWRLGRVNTALTKLNAMPANVKALLQVGIDRCQASYDASQPGVESDVVKAAERLTLANRECDDLIARGEKASAYVAKRAVFDARLGDFMGHGGKLGIADVITRMEADSVAAATDAAQRKFDSATRILATSEGDWPSYKTRADDYLTYKTKRDGVEARLVTLRADPQAGAATDELAVCDGHLRQAATLGAARDYKSALDSVTAADAAADVVKELLKMRAEMAALKKDEVLAAVDKDVVAAFKNYEALEAYVAGKDDGTFGDLRTAAAAEAQQGRTSSLGASPDLDKVRAHLGAAIAALEGVLERVACKGAYTTQRAAIRPSVETELTDGSAAHDGCLASELQAISALLTQADDAVKAPGFDFSAGLAKVNEAQPLVASARKKLASYIVATPLKAKLDSAKANLIESRDAGLAITPTLSAEESLQVEVDRVTGFCTSFDADWAAGKYGAAVTRLTADAKRAEIYEAQRADHVKTVNQRQHWIFNREALIANDPLVEAERQEVAAAKGAISGLLQTRTHDRAHKIEASTYHVIKRGQDLLLRRTAYGLKRAAAEAKVLEAETEAAKVASNAGLTAQAAALRLRYTEADAETAPPKRRFDHGEAEMDALVLASQPVITACEAYLLFDTSRQLALEKIEEVKDHAQAGFITLLIARLDGKYANMVELADQGHMEQAVALAQVLPQDCAAALVAAQNTAALAQVGDDLTAIDEDDSDAIAAAVTKLREVFDLLRGDAMAQYAQSHDGAKAAVEAIEAQLKTEPNAAKAAIPAALASCKALQIEIGHHQQLQELASRITARITSETAAFVKYAIIQEDADNLTATVSAALAAAQAGGDLTAASDTIETVIDQHYALMRMAGRHDQLVQDCDALEAQHKTLLGSEHRYAIREDLERLAGYLVQAREGANGRNHDIGETHVKTAQDLAVDAVAKNKMAANQPPDPKNIKAILDRPDGDARLDEMIKGLDASAQRRVLKVAFEAKYGCKLNLYIDASSKDGAGNPRDIHAAGNLVAADAKKGPNIRRLYEVMSALPPKDTRDNDSMAIFGYEMVEQQKGSVYASGNKEVLMREGNANLSSVYGFGRPHEVGEVDANCEPVDQKQVDFFSWNTLHEAGHAVDDQRSFMKGVVDNVAYGGWQNHGQNVKPAADAIAGHYSYDASYVAQYISDPTAVLALPECPGNVAPEVWEQRRGQVCAHVDMARADRNPWSSAALASKLNIGGRVYHESYKESGTWSSYAFAARKQAITGYQFRASGEWFSELYAAYHSKKLKKQHPAVSWLKELV